MEDKNNNNSFFSPSLSFSPFPFSLFPFPYYTTTISVTILYDDPMDMMNVCIIGDWMQSCMQWIPSLYLQPFPLIILILAYSFSPLPKKHPLPLPPPHIILFYSRLGQISQLTRYIPFDSRQATAPSYFITHPSFP